MKQLVRSFRFLKNNLKLTLINVFCMALGLVSAGIILGFVYQEFNYDSGNNNSENIYRIIQEEDGNKDSYTYGPLAQALKADFPEIEKAVRVSFYYGYLACSAGENKFNENSAIFTDPDFFTLFSFPLLKGNINDCLSSPNSVVISEKAANKYFGSEDPMGKHLRIGEDREIMVTGVFQNFKANSNFEGDLIIPLKKISKLTQIWIEPSWDYSTDIHTFIKVEDSADIKKLAIKAKDIISKFVENNQCFLSFQRLKDIHLEKQLYWESVPHANVIYLYILLTVAFIILGISSANFLFLYIGTTTKRATNTGIKKVCGASKVRLFFEHIREVLVLLLISVVVSIFLFGIYHLALTNYFIYLPRLVSFDYKMGLLLFAVLITVAFIAGIYPAVVLSSQKPVHILKTKKTVATGKIKLVNMLVVSQFFLCIVLIASTFIMYEQTTFLENKDTGFVKEELITIPLNMPMGQGINNEEFDVFSEELKKFPGVKNVTLAYSSPSINITGESVPNWEGRPENLNVEMNWISVSFDYFETLGLKIVEGRGFNRNFPTDEINWDTRKGAFILNQSAVKEMGITDPIGKEFEVWGFKGPIVGIVEDYNFTSLHSAIKPAHFEMNPIFRNEIIVRINPLNQTALSDIKMVWNKLVADYPLEFNYVSSQIKTIYLPEKNLSRIINIFSIIALLIASMGLFTLTILSTNQRTKEIGIRKVNGAKVSEVLTMLNKDYVKWVGVAFIIAVPVSWFIMYKWLQNFAYKTELSWWIFVLAGGVAIVIALITVSWQSYRAAIQNPVEALKYE